LKISCEQQNLQLVNLLLDYKVQRRQSSLNLLHDYELQIIQKRFEEEEKINIEIEKKLLKEKNRKYYNNDNANNFFQQKNAWVEYIDKKTKNTFYYNKVTRRSQFEIPSKDYKPDKNRVITEATFGMNFYH
jgi:hypothetical protein